MPHSDCTFGQRGGDRLGTNIVKYLFRALAAFAILFAGANAASAQGWPNRPIRMIVPYTAGGYTDLMARLVGQKISEAPTPSSAPTSSPRPRPTATRSAP
jgi:hypothetical protein